MRFKIIAWILQVKDFGPGSHVFNKSNFPMGKPRQRVLAILIFEVICF